MDTINNIMVKVAKYKEIADTIRRLQDDIENVQKYDWNYVIEYDEETGDEKSRTLDKETQYRISAMKELIADLEKLAK